MNPALIILAAGYGYLAGNPKARQQFFSAINEVAGKGVDALNNLGKTGGEPDVSAESVQEESDE